MLTPAFSCLRIAAFGGEYEPMHKPCPVRLGTLVCLAGLLLSDRSALAGAWDFNGQAELTKDKVEPWWTTGRQPPAPRSPSCE